jgi:hypothetical protein
MLLKWKWSAHCAIGSRGAKSKDAAARAYLEVIGRNPSAVAEALRAKMRD